MNWAIYRLAWNRRPISPWSPPDPSAPPRRLCDRLPIVGWLGLRREAALHGAGFWIRPMLIEILPGAGPCLAVLVGSRPRRPAAVLRSVAIAAIPAVAICTLEFASHVILIALMLAASMIDVDEKTIPDEITVVGTLVGLLLAAVWPYSLLPDVMPGCRWQRWDFLNLTSPNDWPAVLDGAPNAASLAVGLGLLVGVVRRRFCRDRGIRVTDGGGPCNSAAPA